MKHITTPSDHLPGAHEGYLSASSVMRMPETTPKPKQPSKSIAQLFIEPHAWIADGRFTDWDDAPAPEHAFPAAPPAAMTLYEKFGEECAVRDILPTYRLFEHWLDSGAIGEDVRDRHLGRRRN
jgi:hypothetical protein